MSVTAEKPLIYDKIDNVGPGVGGVGMGVAGGGADQCSYQTTVMSTFRQTDTSSSSAESSCSALCSNNEKHCHTMQVKSCMGCNRSSPCLGYWFLEYPGICFHNLTFIFPFRPFWQEAMILKGVFWTPIVLCLDLVTPTLHCHAPQPQQAHIWLAAGAMLTNQKSATTPSSVDVFQREGLSMPTSYLGQVENHAQPPHKWCTMLPLDVHHIKIEIFSPLRKVHTFVIASFLQQFIFWNEDVKIRNVSRSLKCL